jgi:putative SOS response-associated peptidase YedK
MCARTTRRNSSAIQQAYRAVDWSQVQARLAGTANTPPRGDQLGLASDAPTTATWLSWGLMPGWAREWKQGATFFQARAESVAEKPTYRDAWKKGRRAAFLVDGFIDYVDVGKAKKEPHLVQVDGGQPFALAALWQDWTGTRKAGEAVETVRTATLLMVDANASVTPINDRMPVILTGADLERWLGCSVEEAAGMMTPFAAERTSQTVYVPTAAPIPPSEQPAKLRAAYALVEEAQSIKEATPTSAPSRADGSE